MLNSNNRSIPSILKSWIVFLLYIVIASIAMYFHEPWGDEIHSWNIVKASNSLSDLLKNFRYEGHPPVWYLIMWTISKFSHDFMVVQLVHLLIASVSVYLLLFRSPFPFIIKALIPFGYYFLFEYSVLSRNYAVGILACFCICLIMHKQFRNKQLLYYFLLIILSNTHLLALILASTVHFYFLLMKMESKTKWSRVFAHAAVGLLVLLPSVYFIYPPSDSSLGLDFFASDWKINRLGLISKIPLRSFIPMPAWWDYHFWNTHFITASQDQFFVLKIAGLMLSVIVTLLMAYILKDSKKALAFFIVNLILSCIISLLLPLTSARYIGFIFIGFIVAAWLHYYESPIRKSGKNFLMILFIIQIIPAAFSITKDIQLPFSNANRVGEVIRKVPSNEKIVTDYWAVNPISAFTNDTFYCIGFDRKISYLLWNSEFKNKKPADYTNSLNKLFSEGHTKIYLVSTNAPEVISRLDPNLSRTYNLNLIEKIEGSIEKSGNIYLYDITRMQKNNNN